MAQTKDRVIIGDLSNLIDDMISKGATIDELRNVTTCYTLVLDAIKAGEDYKDAIDIYDIEDLKKKYQANK